MTYSDAIRFLYDLRLFGLKLGLQTPRILAQQLGQPHDHLRFIHVAGTNGKGSTCAILEAIYRTAGLRVGLFTSPHLIRFNERIQVNRQPISEPDVARLVANIRPALDRFPRDRHPTFFEVVTVLALQYFAEQQCDLVVWETGMGGRLDATNIVTPLASLITNIHLDHQKWLGSSLARIATEKAGIIKPNVPTLTATEQPEALDVISRTARSRNAPLTVVTRAQLARALTPVTRLSLPGQHQQLNAALALAAVHILEPVLPVSQAHIESALRNVQWPGRLQLVHRPPDQRVLLDGAHNIAGAEALHSSFLQLFPGVRPTLILGILEDKDWLPIIRVLAPLARRILCVPIRSERTASPAGLAAASRNANPGADIHPCLSLESALSSTTADPFILITGSLYLVGEALQLLDLSPTHSRSEAALNDYLTVP